MTEDDELFELLEAIPPLEPVCMEWADVPGEVAALRADRRCEVCDTDEHGAVDPVKVASVVHLLARTQLMGFPAPTAVYSHCGSPMVEWHFGDSPGPRVSVAADFYTPGVSRVLMFGVASDGTHSRTWYSVLC